MKKQIIIIGGGNVFDDHEGYLESLSDYVYNPIRASQSGRGWKDGLQEDFGGEYEVVMPSMPCCDNAKYEEWKVVFERLIPYLDKKIVLVGHSLGGIFLIKYLSENIISRKIDSLHLVSAPFWVGKEIEKKGGFTFDNDLISLTKQAKQIFLYHSKDDFIVPFSDSEKFVELLPSINMISFEDKGHFIGGDFPELVSNISS